MICKFCGNEIEGRPIRQDDGIYCSIDCADKAAVEYGDIDSDYLEENDFDLLDDNRYNYDADDGAPY
jgi:hypothetical protein